MGKSGKSSGATLWVITARNHEGFCLFDSRPTEFKASNTPAGRDLIEELVACPSHAGRGGV
jgi:alpha-L-fucosidase